MEDRSRECVSLGENCVSSQLFNFNGPLAWFVWCPIVAISLFAWLRHWEYRGIYAITRVLADANEKYGTSFPTSPKPKPKHPLMLGPFSYPNSYCLIFDTEKRKVAISRHGACDIQDIEYIREWQLHWTERSHGSSVSMTDPYLVLGTSDLNRPILKVRLASVNEGREWERRLGILVNG